MGPPFDVFDILETWRCVMDDAIWKDAAAILGVAEPPPIEASLMMLGAGMRTRAVICPRANTTHRFGEGVSVVVKLYKGRGNASAAETFRRFHGALFPALPQSVRALPIQTSIEAGMAPAAVPYAVLEYIPGVPLRALLEDANLRSDAAQRLLRELLCGLWIPIWAAGLRFKDCHPGNFIRRPDGVLAMIDTEQMRHDATELLSTPHRWTQRDRHESSGLRRLPGLLERVSMATSCSLTLAARRRTLKALLARVELQPCLAALGRSGSGDAEVLAAESAVERLIAAMRDEEVLG